MEVAESESGCEMEVVDVAAAVGGSESLARLV